MTKHRHTLDIKLCGSKTRRLLKLNHEHYEKLKCLWELAREAETGSAMPSDEYAALLKSQEKLAMQGSGQFVKNSVQVLDIIQEIFSQEI
mgnify:CR=1 FL=1